MIYTEVEKSKFWLKIPHLLMFFLLKPSLNYLSKSVQNFWTIAGHFLCVTGFTRILDKLQNSGRAKATIENAPINLLGITSIIQIVFHGDKEHKTQIWKIVRTKINYFSWERYPSKENSMKILFFLILPFTMFIKYGAGSNLLWIHSNRPNTCKRTNVNLSTIQYYLKVRTFGYNSV